MRLAIAAVLISVLAAGCGGEAADAPLPASGAAYRSLTRADRVAAATTCRDRAVAAAPQVASRELAKVDPHALSAELDLALTAAANRRREFSRLCSESLPFVTPAGPVVFAGATDSGDAYTFQTRSDKPLTIRGQLPAAARGSSVVARREFGAARPFRAVVRADGRFTLPTVPLRKQANNGFVVAFDNPPHALRKVRFSAICLDCLASGTSSR